MRKKETPLSRHHRRPKSLHGSNDPQNISVVPRNLHESWHTLFGDKNPYEIADICNTVWLDPCYYFLVRRRK